MFHEARVPKRQRKKKEESGGRAVHKKFSSDLFTVLHSIKLGDPLGDPWFLLGSGSLFYGTEYIECCSVILPLLLLLVYSTPYAFLIRDAVYCYVFPARRPIPAIAAQ